MIDETSAGLTRPKKRLAPGLKLVLEMGPLVLFFLANQKFGIFPATAALMVAVLVSLAVSYSITRHLPAMPVVTAIFVLIFGSLTFFLQDENFIKLKVTILYALFGSALIGALWFDKLLLPAVFDSAFHLDDAGWRKLTFRWSFFFFFLAGLNEVVRRSVDTDVWVNFKVFGILPLTLLFAFSQIPLMLRHEQREEAAAAEPDSHF
ncbi:septation protein A [Methylosinus sp. Sm6]|uniref:septation protein A n=1 Tax=Methylosinus sp. Sm6 TaxID=2866948 RepID=UPI001C9921CE|nr:septation protein A [Methylosinus sp. Sm6]MBY6242979.1 septation protein A [Methylosinus sp. Sm6]